MIYYIDIESMTICNSMQFNKVSLIEASLEDSIIIIISKLYK